MTIATHAISAAADAFTQAAQHLSDAQAAIAHQGVNEDSAGNLRRRPTIPASPEWTRFRLTLTAKVLLITVSKKSSSSRVKVDGLHSRSRKHHALTACRYQVQAQGRDMINPMAQPHKGDREQIKVRAAAVVYARLREMAAERNTSVSQI